MSGAMVLTALAAEASPGSMVVPWWLRIGFIVYAALLVAVFMIYAQTTHRRPWGLIWILIVVFIPIIGAIAYFATQTVAYRRSGEKPTKGRAETMAPEEYDDGGSTPRG